MHFTVNQIAGMLGGTVKGDGEIKINMLAKIQDAQAGQISFLSNPKYEQHIYTTAASCVIVNDDFVPKKEIATTLILVEDPYSSFTQLLEEYHKFISFQKTGVEDPSFIAKSASVGEGVYRGAFSYIGEEVKIGNNVKIYPNSYIGHKTTIGDNTVIHSGVKIYPNTKVGSNCVLHSGVVLGSAGFGFAPQKDGSYKTIPQMGNVIIGDNVDIGSNTVIDCATMHGDSTIIHSGVKLDNLIQVAHNVEIKSNTVIAAQTGISGSSSIGENCIIGGQVGIAGHIHVHSKTSIAAQSGINKNTSENDKLFGSPAIDYNRYLRSYAIFRKLPELYHRIKELEDRIETEEVRSK